MKKENDWFDEKIFPPIFYSFARFLFPLLYFIFRYFFSTKAKSKYQSSYKRQWRMKNDWLDKKICTLTFRSIFIPAIIFHLPIYFLIRRQNKNRNTKNRVQWRAKMTDSTKSFVLFAPFLFPLIIFHLPIYFLKAKQKS